MATPDTIKHKKKKEEDELTNRAHIVTPDPDEDPGTPKVGVIREDETKVDASPKKKRDAGGPLHLGVNFDGNKE